MIIVKTTKDAEARVIPGEELMSEMGQFNEAVRKARVLLAADGLHRRLKRARVKFSRAKRTLIDGPFAETKELIGGF